MIKIASGEKRFQCICFGMKIFLRGFFGVWDFFGNALISSHFNVWSIHFCMNVLQKTIRIWLVVIRLNMYALKDIQVTLRFNLTLTFSCRFPGNHFNLCFLTQFPRVLREFMQLISFILKKGIFSDLGIEFLLIFRCF